MENENNFEEFEESLVETKIRSWAGEIVLNIALIIFTFLSLYDIVGTTAMLIIVAGVLSSMYFYFSFAMFNGIRLRDIFKKSSYKGISSMRVIGAVFSGLNLSVIVLALLFKIMMWPGSSVMIITGVLGLTIILLIAIVKYRKRKLNYYSNILKRVVPYLAIVAVLFLLPRYAILEFKYSGYNDYIEAIKAADKDPNNKALEQKIKEEEDKMYHDKYE